MIMINEHFTPYDIFCANLVLTVINIAIFLSLLIYGGVHYLQNLY